MGFNSLSGSGFSAVLLAVILRFQISDLTSLILHNINYAWFIYTSRTLIYRVAIPDLTGFLLPSYHRRHWLTYACQAMVSHWSSHSLRPKASRFANSKWQKGRLDARPLFAATLTPAASGLCLVVCRFRYRFFPASRPVRATPVRVSDAERRTGPTNRSIFP